MNTYIFNGKLAGSALVLGSVLALVAGLFPMHTATAVVDPKPETVTISATKIVCDDEAYLPQRSGGDDVTETTAADFLGSNSDHCRVYEGWEFQWAPGQISAGDAPDNDGALSSPWTTSAMTDSNGQVEIEIPLSELDDTKTISFREVMRDGYLPFTGENTTGAPKAPSAELYCYNDVRNYDNLEWITDPVKDETYHCVAWNVPPKLTLSATKVICEDPTMLPQGSSNLTMPIDASTAQAWVDGSDGGCYIEPDWKFQWTEERVMSADTDQMGGELDGWNTFVGSETVLMSELGDEPHLSLREVFKPGYLPFSRHNKDVEGDLPSAEFYCANDGGNFDNMEWVTDAVKDEIYHCVAWNVPLEAPEVDIEACKFDYEDESKPIAGWGMTLYSGELDKNVDYDVTGDDGCVTFTVNPLDGPWYIIEDEKDGWTQKNVTAVEGEIVEYDGEWAKCRFFTPLESKKLDVGDLRDIKLGGLSLMGELNGGKGSYNGWGENEHDNGDRIPLSCNFYNQEEDEPETTTPRSGPVLTGSTPGGQVAGEEITTEEDTDDVPEPEVLGEAVSTCGPLLNTYMRQGMQNDRMEVMLLQIFLTGQGFFTPMTGEFDATTDAQVRAFQAEHANEVLSPWVDAGFMTAAEPTGYVYKTTRWMINNTFCPGSEDWPVLN